jgi:LacI family transcriptional regulator
MTNMRDVAIRAGVSLPTVSYVVNGGPRPVSAETRAKVLKAIEELGYKPNQLAKGLAKKITRAIALIIPNSSDLFFARMAHAVEEAAYSAGFNLFLCNSGQDPERELSYFTSLKEKHIDGILLVTCGISSKQLQQAVDDLPTVILDREIEHVYQDTVVFDNHSAGKQATGHLLQHGHNRIACLAGPQHLLGARQRVEGYQEALRQAGISPDETLVKWSDYTFEGGLRASSELLKSKKLPTAIVACNDEMGVSAIHAARMEGLEVPSDLAIVGMGNSFVGQVAIPQLTTIFASVDEMGKLGAEILLEKINGTASLSPSRQILETRLVVRESCGCNPRKV